MLQDLHRYAEDQMKEISALPKKQIEFVFTDIDDTLTEDGLLLREAFDALWDLHDRGFKVVPVTGRPAGWCELIARQWPVSGVIGENGAFYFRLKNGGMFRHFLIDESQRATHQAKLKEIEKAVLQNVPRAKVASDQFSRLADLAIDFAEDVKPELTADEIQKIVSEFTARGAQAKVSSIHVNGWFGNHDKLECCRIFLQKEFGLKLEDNLDKLVFVGDSPNDEPMFKAFKHSVGVANIKKFTDQLKAKPAYVCSQSGGLGFQEVADHLLA